MNTFDATLTQTPIAGKLTGKIRQKNEELILSAAAEEFARYGYTGTSMNAIALRAAPTLFD